jgi:DNA-binding transcriptional MerR regulator
MIIIKGKAYNTMVDIAHALGVSAKTVRGYIEKGIISAPPEVNYGLRVIKYFPEDYLEKARRDIKNYSDFRLKNSKKE